jgi:hypothetical protein
MIESLLLAVTRVSTFAGDKPLTGATGFFYERDDKLFLVTNRHVVLDEPSDHRPDGLTIDLHTDPDNAPQTAEHQISLYEDGTPQWREGTDSAGVVDVVVIELDRDALPPGVHLRSFNAASLLEKLDRIEVGAPVLVVGFPLGFHDALHHLPVARQAVVASAFGIRFQGSGYFLTDARLHRGMSGAPVVARRSRAGSGREDLPWILLGVHASRMDVSNRDEAQDERLDLNCAWYADIIQTLTDPPSEPAAAAPAPARQATAAGEQVA